MECRIAAISDTGNVREKNEDSYLVCRRAFGKDEIVMLAVADGMGGLSNGEWASRYVTEELQNWWQTTILPLNEEPDLQKLDNMLGFFLEAVQYRMVEVISKRQTKMGTTLSLLFFYKNRYFMKQVGDSRVYCLHHHKLYQLSKDQTWCQREYEEGRLTYEEMLHHEKRHVLVNAFGKESGFYIVSEQGAAQKGQRFLLCSDGYYAYLDAGELYPKPFQRDLQKLLEKSGDRIKEGTAEDNFTAVLMELR